MQVPDYFCSFFSLFLFLFLSLPLSVLQVAPDTHWSDLQVLILVVSDHKKPVSSTSGMRTSVETSSLINVSGKDTCITSTSWEKCMKIWGKMRIEF